MIVVDIKHSVPIFHKPSQIFAKTGPSWPKLQELVDLLDVRVYELVEVEAFEKKYGCQTSTFQKDSYKEWTNIINMLKKTGQFLVINHSPLVALNLDATRSTSLLRSWKVEHRAGGIEPQGLLLKSIYAEVWNQHMLKPGGNTRNQTCSPSYCNGKMV